MRKLIRPLGALAFIALVCCDPAKAASSARGALSKWATQVVPALLPFLAAIPALTCEESRAFFERAAGGLVRFMKCPAGFAPAWLTGLLSGSPAGAAALSAGVSDCGDGALLRGAVLCSGASPAFLLSAVGSGMLGRPQAGWILIGAQCCAALATGLLMRPLPDSARRAQAERPRNAPVPAMLGAARSLLMIGGYMALFSVAAGQLAAWLGPALEKPLLMLLELNGGCEAAASIRTAFPEKLALLAAVSCVGGASVCAQSLSFLRPMGVRPAAYLFWKLVHAGFSALFALLMAAWLPTLELRAVPVDALPAILCVTLLAVAADVLGKRRAAARA